LTRFIAQIAAILATLIRLLGDFDLAEEALHEHSRRPRNNGLVKIINHGVARFDRPIQGHRTFVAVLGWTPH
jgi:hypothetical protein